MSTEIYFKQSCQIKIVCQDLQTIFLTSGKYRMRPVIGHTIFFTSEKNRIGFPAFRRGFPRWECSQLSLLPLNQSWFQGLQTLFQSNNLSKTKKMKIQKRKLNRMLLCLRNFWRWRTNQDSWKKFPQRNWMHTSANLPLRCERTTTTETMNPAPYVLWWPVLNGI